MVEQVKRQSAPELTGNEFANIQRLVFENTGISLSASKKELVKRRYGARLRALGMDSYASYVDYVGKNHKREISNFCNAITTNLTSFFRERHHFDFLEKEGIPLLLEQKTAAERKFRVWSAGCSSGQEAYCLAMLLRETIPAINEWDIRILASDLDQNVLDVARKGIYAEDGFDRNDRSRAERYFSKASLEEKSPVPRLQANSSLKELITFNSLNLITPNWPMRGNFDVIFCRNVFIYFTKETQLELTKRFARLQSPGAYLCLGHSESIAEPEAIGYISIGQTLYQKQ